MRYVCLAPCSQQALLEGLKFRLKRLQNSPHDPCSGRASTESTAPDTGQLLEAIESLEHAKNIPRLRLYLVHAVRSCQIVFPSLLKASSPSSTPRSCRTRGEFLKRLENTGLLVSSTQAPVPTNPLLNWSSKPIEMSASLRASPHIVLTGLTNGRRSLTAECSSAST